MKQSLWTTLFFILFSFHASLAKLKGVTGLWWCSILSTSHLCISRNLCDSAQAPSLPLMHTLAAERMRGWLKRGHELLVRTPRNESFLQCFLPSSSMLPFNLIVLPKKQKVDWKKIKFYKSLPLSKSGDISLILTCYRWNILLPRVGNKL